MQANPGGQFWQSVALENADGGSDPGVVVGSDLEAPPGAGRYELYIGYNFAAAQDSLAFMQAVGVVGAVALLALLTAIIFLVVRWVIEPIRAAAATSRRLAAGDLGVRMPSRGEDELATLAASFNGMADSLQARIRELAELSVMQQRFVSDVSHELRTPLTTIRLAGDVLYGQRDDFPGPTSRTVELLHTQTDRFEMLLSDLLEISRYDAGSVELATEPTNLVHLAGDAIESMYELARERGSELRLVAPGGHLDAEVDPRRIRRIVRNLLGNAIEHGEGRPVVVAVDSNATAIALSVRDYGLGMTEDEGARVFDRFWRADPSRMRTHRRHRPRARDLARRRRRARRHDRRLVETRCRHGVPAHAAAHGCRCGIRRLTAAPRARRRRCRRTAPDRHRRGGGNRCEPDRRRVRPGFADGDRRSARGILVDPNSRGGPRCVDGAPPRHPSL